MLRYLKNLIKSGQLTDSLFIGFDGVQFQVYGSSILYVWRWRRHTTKFKSWAWRGGSGHRFISWYFDEGFHSLHDYVKRRGEKATLLDRTAYTYKRYMRFLDWILR